MSSLSLHSSAARAVVPSSTVGDSVTLGTSVAPLLPLTPLLQQMFAGKMSWADLLCDASPLAAVLPFYAAATPLLRERPVPTTVQDFLEAFAVDEHVSDVYDTRGLSDTEFRAMMNWLCQHGWDLGDYERDWIVATPATNFACEWIDYRNICGDHHHGGCCGHKKEVVLSAPGTDQGRRVAAPVPRFCKDARNCQKAGCAYVHGDTIPRLNEPCRFKAECGASDPTGVKRSQCLRMHPGEEYHIDLVVRRC